MEAVDVLLVISVKTATTNEISNAITSGEKSFRIRNCCPSHSDKPDSCKHKQNKHKWIGRMVITTMWWCLVLRYQLNSHDSVIRKYRNQNEFEFGNWAYQSGIRLKQVSCFNVRGNCLYPFSFLRQRPSGRCLLSSSRSSFFLCTPTKQGLLSTCFDGFWPNVIRMTTDRTRTCHMSLTWVWFLA